MSPRNRAFGDHRVVALIGVAPIPNRRCRCTGIRRVIIAIIIATVIRSRCEYSPEKSKASTETYCGTNSPAATVTTMMPTTAVPVTTTAVPAATSAMPATTAYTAMPAPLPLCPPL